MKAADLMLLLGDNAYQNGTDAEYTSGFFGAYQSTILKNHILFPTPGNHDYANDAGRQDDHAVPYYDIFTVPDAGPVSYTHLDVYKRQANKYELHPMIQMLKEEYRRLQLYSNPKASQKAMMKEYEEDSISADEHLRILQLQELSFHALLLRRKTHFRQSKEDKKIINTLLQNPLLQKEPKSASFWHLHHYRMTKATLGYLSNDATSYNYAYANIHAWQSKEYFIAHDCENYMEVLYIFYYTASLAKDYQHVIDVMQHSANKQIKGVAHKAYFETIRHLALNRVYNKLADYDKVKVLVKVMKDHIAGWEQYINTDLLRTLRLSVGISCFVLQDYENAFHYVKNATLLFNDDTRPEHYSFCLLYTSRCV